MPTDARSLLRAAANERAKASATGISDPFASYSSTGGLRCSACKYLTIKHESLWGAHVLSKSHRSNVARIREEELSQAELQRTKDGKRKAQDAPAQDDHREALAASTTNADDRNADAASGSKKARVDTDQENDIAPSVDPEWELFKAQLESAEPGQGPAAETNSAGAALEAEAQLISNDDAGRNDGTVGNDAEELTIEEVQAQERARKEQEEREEILSRLEEEQRQQDEADQRVSALKQRLQRIKQARLDKQKANK
ncbi:hypothetical protein PSEUBRA_005961 [Kalmanozyma brasiliensis GHG001]|uniref:Coiled-coil domain-containing protein 16 n=1 Tax=Kalmanozyma brasiliensis (strain GHG001) TaxID=1365824 RepID=V5EJ02_KALBG|nr:uncharacterized protein PSEUBRA_005961 [Kalmanozyma brasiliensis GHG001]EST04685.1 hypothetical protein PSEUBRA_005961 [Kalmanozyma brasiliensis GHG001]